jgi:hypothetical protein
MEVAIMKVLTRITCLLILALVAAGPGLAAPLGTGFSYQGQLIQGGMPVTGNVTLRFSLWDAVSGGAQIGASQIAASTPVTNGLFVVQLNDASQFGANPFNGDARWLQIEVCSDVSCSAAPTVLTPRQPISATPYSRFSAGPWQLSGGNVYFNNGNVGIGTSTPHTMLELQSGFGTEVLRFGLDNSDYHFMSTGFHGAQAQLNYLGFNIEHGSNDVRRVMTLQGDGNVGIGTSTPVAKLDVLGNIYLGAGPRYSVPGAEEDLKMVRGILNASGTPTNGCCYFTTHPSTGEYTITFTTPFTGTPTVTCNAYAVLNPLHIELINPSTTGVGIQVRDAGGNLVNSGFHFLAIGPR